MLGVCDAAQGGREERRQPVRRDAELVLRAWRALVLEQREASCMLEWLGSRGARVRWRGAAWGLVEEREERREKERGESVLRPRRGGVRPWLGLRGRRGDGPGFVAEADVAAGDREVWPERSR